MKHPIQNTIDQQRGRAKRLVLLFGLSCSISVILGVLLIVCWVDYVARFSDIGLRTLGSFLVASSALLASVYLLWPSIRFRLSPLQFAHAIERRFPHLGERLTTSVSFLASAPKTSAGSPSANSVTMRESVIESTAEMIGTIKWDEAYDRRRPMQALAIAIGLLAVLGGWMILDSDNSSLALRRTLLPWQSLSWPKRNELTFDRLPAYIEVGGALEIEIRDLNDRLPAKVILETRVPGSLDVRRFETRVRDGIASRRLSNLGENVEVRAVGGDDETRWHLVQVLPAPEVEMQRVQVQPPTYLNAATYECTGDVAGASGSLLSISGKANQVVERAELVLSLPNGEERIPLNLEDDGLSFSLPDETVWLLDESGQYCVELTSDLGLVGRPNPMLNLTAKIDRAPTVDFRIESLDGFVTRNALLSYRVLLQDDFRIESARLDISTEFGGTWETVDLLRDFADRASRESESSDSLTLQSVDSIELESGIDLRNYPQVRTGDKLVFQCSVADLLRQHTVHEPVELRVLTDAEFLERMGRYESELVGTLQTALEAQRRSIELFSAVDGLIDEEPSNWEVYRLQLEAADFQQQRVAVLLGSSPDAATRQCEALIKTLTFNRLVETKVGFRIANVLDALTELRDQQLPAVRKAYDQWIQSLAQANREPGTTDPSELSSRSDFVNGQTAIQQTLVELIEQLGRWQDVRSVIEQLLQLKEDQQLLVERVDRLQARSLDRSADETTREFANTQSCADEQLELARRLDRIVGGIREDVAEATTDTGQELKNLRTTLELADRLAVSGVMRSAADEIRDARLGIGRTLQSEALDAISQLIQSLRQADEIDSEERTEQFNEAERGIEAAIDLEAEIIRQLAEAEAVESSGGSVSQSERDELDRQQRDVEGMVRELAEQLRDQNMRSASRRLDEAAEAMDNASNAIASADTRRAINNANRASTALKEAQRDLRTQAAAETANRFASDLETIVGLLQAALGKQVSIRELNEALITDGPPDERGELFWLSVLLDRQEELRADIESMQREATPINSLELVLGQVQREMGRAAEHLRSRQEPQRALPSMLRAEKLLGELVDLFAPGERPNSTADPNPSADPPTPPKSSQGADLRTIRLLQADVLEQTRELETAMRDRGVSRTSEEYQRLAELSALQRVLMERIKAAADAMRGEVESQGIPGTESDPTGRPPLILPPTGGRD